MLLNFGKALVVGFVLLTALLLTMRLRRILLRSRCPVRRRHLEMSGGLRVCLHTRCSAGRIPRPWIRTVHADGRYWFLAPANLSPAFFGMACPKTSFPLLP